MAIPALDKPTEFPVDRRELVFNRLKPGNHYRIAKLARMTISHVSRVLRGKCGMSFPAAIRISDAAGVTANELWEYMETIPNRKGRIRLKDSPMKFAKVPPPEVRLVDIEKAIRRYDPEAYRDRARAEVMRRAGVKTPVPQPE